MTFLESYRIADSEKTLVLWLSVVLISQLSTHKKKPEKNQTFLFSSASPPAIFNQIGHNQTLKRGV